MKNTPAVQVGNPPRPNPASGWLRFRDAILTGLAAVMAMTLILASSSCESPEAYTPIPPEAMSARPTGILAAGDVIRVTYPGAPELNTVQKILANGKVSLPSVGDVSAEGKTVATFQSQLTGLYQPHLPNPTVVVALEEVAACVYVSGEVNKPGKVPLDRSMTAFEAIMESGGFSKLANPKQVVVVRNKDGKSERYVLNLSDTLTGASSSTFYLRPYDVIYVKQTTW